MAMETKTLERKSQSKIDRLRELLGPRVVFLPCSGKRPVLPSWQKFTVEIMNDASYIRRLNAAQNIGVLLGTASDGLCVADFDVDGADDEFLAFNPILTDTLRTRGRRGSSFWIRVTGDFPSSTKLKRSDGEIGEWRASGNQSIILGTHPESGEPYRFLNEGKPVECRFDQIMWPGGVFPPNITHLHTTTSVSSVISVGSVNSVNLCPSLSSLSLSVTPLLTEDEVIKRSVVTNVHTSHKRLFDLARGVLTLEKTRGKLPQTELESLFGRWHGASLPFLRPECSKEDYFAEFLEACDRAEHGLDESVLNLAWMKSKTSPPPAVASDFKSLKISALICLCQQLQVCARENPFFLSCRSAAGILEISHAEAARQLRLLVRRGVLKIIERGGPDTNRATRYKFVTSTKR